MDTEKLKEIRKRIEESGQPLLSWQDIEGKNMNMTEAERAYQSQPVFRQLVDMMVSHLMQGDFSVYELRDACTLAMNMYAMRKPLEPILLPPGFHMIDGKDGDLSTGVPLASPLPPRPGSRRNESQPIKIYGAGVWGDGRQTSYVCALGWISLAAVEAEHNRICPPSDGMRWVLDTDTGEPNPKPCHEDESRMDYKFVEAKSDEDQP